jgi:hypothetical protein
MRNSRRIAKLATILAFAVMVLSQSSFAQVRRSTTVATEHQSSPRLPYTAEYQISSVRVLANGTTITHDYTEIRAIDSQGRTVFQRTSPRAEEGPIVHSFVIDPAAHTTTDWNSKIKKATVHPFGSAAMAHDCSAALVGNTDHLSAKTSQEKPVIEKLGTETIQGIEARGTRTTTTIATGEDGNDAPLVRTHEQWTAINPGLHNLVVRASSDDPRFGKNSRELTSFAQGEPDASLFSPPSDYEIINRPAGGTCSIDSSATSSPNESPK